MTTRIPQSRATAAALLVAAVALIAAAATALVVGRSGGDTHAAESPAAESPAARPAASTAPGPTAGVGPAPARTATTAQATPGTPSSGSPTSSLTPVGDVTDHPARAITYVVRPGDNLTVIAAWFKLHGYGDLYDRNKAIIGADPNLILPGQRITISSAGASVGG